jgi:TM2 domain-containing membrane protein YozV
MEQNAIVCSSCGAPGKITDGESKWVCEHCGRETLLESKFVQNLSEKVTSSFQDVGNQTQLELQRLQYSQELSMLQMQLSNLNSEKRSLERENSKASYVHLGQVMAEESRLKDRIAVLQNKLPAVPPSISGQRVSLNLISDPSASTKSWGSTVFLAFTLGLFGGHRYYTGKTGTAIIQTLTLGGFFIWWIIDLIAILSGNFKDSKGNPLNREIKTNKTLVIVVGLLIIFYVIIGLTGGASQSSTSTSTTNSPLGYFILTIIMLVVGLVISKPFSKES